MRLSSFLCVMMLVLSAPTAVLADEKTVSADRMIEIFINRCVGPLMAEEEVNGEGMNALPEKTARWLNDNSTGRAWMPDDVYVALIEIVSKSGELYGCTAHWQAGLPADRETDAEHVASEFSRWADQEIAAGRFIEIRHCGSPEHEYSRVLESRTERSKPVRVALFITREINFVMMSGGEVPEAGSPVPCAAVS